MQYYNLLYQFHSKNNENHSIKNNQSLRTPLLKTKCGFYSNNCGKKGKNFNDIRLDNKYVHDLGEWVAHGREQALPYRKLTKELNHVYPIMCLLSNYKLPSYPLANRIKDRGISKNFRVYKVYG